jgi:hypothetical protein
MNAQDLVDFLRKENKWGIEEIFDALEILLTDDRKTITHDLQKKCVDAAIEHLGNAHMAYYASTK